LILIFPFLSVIIPLGGGCATGGGMGVKKGLESEYLRIPTWFESLTMHGMGDFLTGILRALALVSGSI